MTDTNNPPAAPEGSFDVREALTLIARDVHLHDGGENAAITGPHAQRIADAIRERFEVRPRGTVTDAEGLLATRAGLALANAAWQEGASAVLRATNEHTDGPWSSPVSPYSAPLLALIHNNHESVEADNDFISRWVVTNSMVEAAWKVIDLRDMCYISHRDIRAALEAACEARP